MLEDRAGQLWVGVDDKLYIYRDGNFIPINLPDGKPLGSLVTAITEDTDDDIWAEVVWTSCENWYAFKIRNGTRTELCENAGALRAIRWPAIPVVAIWIGLFAGVWLGIERGPFAKTFMDLLIATPIQFRFARLRLSSDGSVLGAPAEGIVGLRNGKTADLSTDRNGPSMQQPLFRLFGMTGELFGWPLSAGWLAIAGEELRKWWEYPQSVVKVATF